MATPIETVPDAPTLTLLDRCDACGAAAQARAVKLYERAGEDSTLLFCGHHSAAHGPALLAQGWALS